MSIFGKIMIVVFLLWSIITIGWLASAGDVFVFMRNRFIIVIVGYIAIIVITIFAKRLVASM